jgi:NADPH:quinone reductase-like Zn-dependent oxidoreductase
LAQAASGGVGSLAVQLAKWKGAYVFATSSGKNRTFVQSIGADEVIDYRSVRFQDVVKDVNVVFDAIGGYAQENSLIIIWPIFGWA